MNVAQLTPSDHAHLEALVGRGTSAAAGALGSLLGREVGLGRSSLRVAPLRDMERIAADLPRHATVIYLESSDELAGHLLLVLPVPTATLLARELFAAGAADAEPGVVDRAGMREDVLSEVGNIVLTSYLNELVLVTGLEAEPTVPLVASDDVESLLRMPLARAAGDNELLVRFDSQLAFAGHDGEPLLRGPFHLLYLPEPGVLESVLAALGAADGDGTRDGVVRVPVGMGELAVSRRPGDVLVARALGSCVAVVLADSANGVAALAHVMLPTAPDVSPNATAAAARYADTAIPALLAAFERAGGSLDAVDVHLVGGGQMFRGRLAAGMDVPQRNLAAVRAALDEAGLAVDHDETGGSIGRSVSVQVATGELQIRVDERQLATATDALQGRGTGAASDAG